MTGIEHHPGYGALSFRVQPNLGCPVRLVEQVKRRMTRSERRATSCVAARPSVAGTLRHSNLRFFATASCPAALRGVDCDGNRGSPERDPRLPNRAPLNELQSRRTSNHALTHMLQNRGSEPHAKKAGPFLLAKRLEYKMPGIFPSSSYLTSHITRSELFVLSGFAITALTKFMVSTEAVLHQSVRDWFRPI